MNALRHLPLREREVVVLRLVLDLDTATTARQLGISSASGIDPNSPVFRAAQKTCRRYFPGPHLSQAQIAEQEASALKFAACMRKNGVPNFPDPQFGPNGARIAGPVSGVDPNSPTYQAAAEKCGG